MAQALRKSFISGIAWTGVSRSVTQLIQFTTTLILARLLFPEDFGTIGMAVMFIQLAKTINQLGLTPAIIYRKEIDDQHLSTAFWANLFTGTILCLITILISDTVARFFHNEAVNPILRILSITFILGSFRAVQNALLTKGLKFDTIALINTTEALANGVLATVLAYFHFGVWSLVYGRLFGLIVGVSLTWFLVSWRPRRLFVYAKFKDLFNFGVHVMGTNMVTYVCNNVDYLIVGKFLGSVPLGIYTMAFNLVTLPQRKFTSIIKEVLFPIFSKIQDDTERISKNYLTLLKYISVITFPMLCGLLVTAPEFIGVLFGAKWQSVIKPMQIMCIAGMLRSVTTTVGSLFYSCGRPDLEFRLDILSICTLVPLLLLGVHHGIITVAFVVAIHTTFMFFIFFTVIAGIIKVKLTDIIRALYPALLICTGMTAILVPYRFFFKLLFPGQVLLLLTMVILGVVVFYYLLKTLFPKIFDATIGVVVQKCSINLASSGGRVLQVVVRKFNSGRKLLKQNNR